MSRRIPVVDTPNDAAARPEPPDGERDEDRGRRAPTSSTAGSGAEAPAPSGTPVTQQLGRVVLIVVAVLFGVFAVFNFQYVDFNWVFGKTEVVQVGGQRTGGGIPLIVLLLASFALGALVAWIATVRSERRRRKRTP